MRLQVGLQLGPWQKWRRHQSQGTLNFVFAPRICNQSFTVFECVCCRDLVKKRSIMMQSPLGRLTNQSSCKHAKLGFTVWSLADLADSIFFRFLLHLLQIDGASIQIICVDGCLPHFCRLRLVWMRLQVGLQLGPWQKCRQRQGTLNFVFAQRICNQSFTVFECVCCRDLVKKRSSMMQSPLGRLTNQLSCKHVNLGVLSSTVLMLPFFHFPPFCCK